jgi:hypothetical protein
MKNLHFALCGNVILLYLIASCSFGEMDLFQQEIIEEITEDDAEAKEGTPVINEEESSDDNLSTNDQPTSSLPDDEEAEEKIPWDEIPDVMPEILINELRTEYSGTSLAVEFIEFKILSHGNLGGLRVFIASNTTNPLIYEFLPVRVRKGEYVVLHLRKLEESKVDEYGEDLNQSGGRDSSPTGRDFWVPGNTKWLRKTDAVYIMDQDDQILDAVMLAVAPFPSSSLRFFTETAEFLFNNGAWKSAGGKIPGPEDAVNSTPIGTALTRSISRDETAEDTNTSADWYITVNGGATPGRRNDPRRL